MAVQYFVFTLYMYYCENNLLWHEIDIKKHNGSSTTIRTQRIDIDSGSGRWNNIIYNCSGAVDMIDNNNNTNNSNDNDNYNHRQILFF